MRTRLLSLALPLAAAVGAAACTGSGSRSEALVTDFEVTPHPTDPVWQAEVEPAADAPVKEFRIPVTHETITIADGVTYAGWTLGGTVPGPVIRVREGDRVRVHLVNASPMMHSIDFHAARIPMSDAFRSIPPGEEWTYEFVARDPGAFMVHCGTPPVLLHIMQGMYLAIIVDPKGGWPGHADREFVLVESEFYAATPDSPGASRGPDWDAAMRKQPTQAVFNGRAFQYQRQPLRVTEGERVRFFVVNAGPSATAAFHIVGAVFDRVYPDGDPAHALTSVQTWNVPPGGGAVFETTFAANGSGAGKYAFVTHAFADAEKGAVGTIEVEGIQ